MLTPYTKQLLERLPPLVLASDTARRAQLKEELVALGRKSRGGLDTFGPEDQERFDSILGELPALIPMEAPARSPLFSGEWECLWTTEKELNFAVEAGGPWMH